MVIFSAIDQLNMIFDAPPELESESDRIFEALATSMEKMETSFCVDRSLRN